MKKILKYIFRKFFFRGWEYQLKSASNTYDFVFDKLTDHEKLIRWIKISDYLRGNFENKKIDLIDYPKNINNKIISKLNLTKEEEYNLKLYSSISYYDFEFIKKFTDKNSKIIEIGPGFGRMMPLFFDYKNYIAYEPIKKVYELLIFFSKIIERVNIKFITNLSDLEKEKKVDIYYSSDCLGELSTKVFIDYIILFKKNLNNNGLILIRDWWWNKNNLKYLKECKDFDLKIIEINYYEKNDHNNWCVLRKYE